MSDPAAPPRAWDFYLDDMIGFAEKVLRYTGGLDQNQFIREELIYDATLRNLELIGEAATHIPEAVRATESGSALGDSLVATRNRLIHGYLGIDDDAPLEHRARRWGRLAEALTGAAQPVGALIPLRQHTGSNGQSSQRYGRSHLAGLPVADRYTLGRLIEPQTALQSEPLARGYRGSRRFSTTTGCCAKPSRMRGAHGPIELFRACFSRSGNGLLQRAVAVTRTHPACKVRLLSFGPFGQELLDAWKGSATARDRGGREGQNAGLSPSDISLLFERLTLERLDENTEWAKVEQFLSAAHALAGQSSHAAAILCHWLYWLAKTKSE